MAPVPDPPSSSVVAPRVTADSLRVEGLPAVAADGRTVLAAIRREGPADWGQLEIYRIARDDTPTRPYIAILPDPLGEPLDEARKDDQRGRADRWLAKQHLALELHPMTVLAAVADRRRAAGRYVIDWGPAGVRVLDGAKVLQHHATPNWVVGDLGVDCTVTAVVAAAAIDVDRRIAAIEIAYRSGIVSACEGELATWHVIAW